MKFTYKAKTKDGQITTGVIEASDRSGAIVQIRDRGESVFSITEDKSRKGFSVPFVDDLFARVSLHEKIMFTRNLSGMLAAGLSLYRALGVLEKQTQNKKFNKILKSLMKDIDAGGTLSGGMTKFPNVFSTLFVSMIRAGEESGGMVGALKEIGLNLDKTYSLNKKIKGALTYPLIIVSAIVLIGILMFIFVVPTLTKTFKELGVALPASTRFIIWVSDMISNHLFILVGLLIALVGGFWYLARLPSLQKYFDFVLLRLPVIGGIAQEVNTARTARTLSSLLMSGVDVTRALTITKDVLQNLYYKRVVEKAIDTVQKGIPLSTTFKADTKLYPVMFSEMVEVGEETGKLSEMLLSIAEFYEDEVEAKTKNLSTIVEPVLMIFIGGAVGFFAISMLTPMYSLLDNIK